MVKITKTFLQCRPISLLSIVSKVLEHHVHTLIMDLHGLTEPYQVHASTLHAPDETQLGQNRGRASQLVCNQSNHSVAKTARELISPC